MKQESNGFSDVALIALAAGAVIVGILLAPAYALAWALGLPAPSASPLAVFGLFSRPGAVGEILGTPIPAIGYWVTFAALVALVATIALLVLRKHLERDRESGDDPHLLPGLASAQVIHTRLSGPGLVKRGHIFRPSLTRPRPEQVGYQIGTARGIRVWLPVEHSILLLGPARQGKDLFIVLRMICEAPGAVLSTSLRAENMVRTLKHRAAQGPIGLFAPEGLDSLGSAGADVAGQLVSWSLTGGCSAPDIAQRRARALAANAGKGVENGTFWQKKTEQALAPMLMAAELDGGGTEALFRWGQRPALAREAVDILSSHPDAPEGWAGALDAIVSDAGDSRTRANIWAQVEATIVQPLLNPAVRAAVTPHDGRGVDVEDFIRQGGTMYVVAGDSGTAPGIVAALVEDFYAVAYKMANRSPGNRLDPPLQLSLDELANIAVLPSLPSMISAGGGAGITTLAVLQSLSQARDTWGGDAAGAIWGSATSKIILGGLAEKNDLDQVSEMAGEYTAQTRTRQARTGILDTSQHSISEQQRRVMLPAQVRAMPFGTGLLLSGSVPPVPLRLEKFDDLSYVKKKEGRDGRGVRTESLPRVQAHREAAHQEGDPVHQTRP